jgi:hypothetical protein
MPQHRFSFKRSAGQVCASRSVSTGRRSAAPSLRPAIAIESCECDSPVGEREQAVDVARNGVERIAMPQICDMRAQRRCREDGARTEFHHDRYQPAPSDLRGSSAVPLRDRLGRDETCERPRGWRNGGLSQCTEPPYGTAWAARESGRCLLRRLYERDICMNVTFRSNSGFIDRSFSKQPCATIVARHYRHDLPCVRMSMRSELRIPACLLEEFRVFRMRWTSVPWWTSVRHPEARSTCEAGACSLVRRTLKCSRHAFRSCHGAATCGSE